MENNIQALVLKAMQDEQDDLPQNGQTLHFNDDADDVHICPGCYENRAPHKLVELPCGDTYCGSCLQSILIVSMTDETFYPPQCCGSTISTKHVKKHVSKSLIREFQSKQLELSTKDRTYCHKPKCSTFIAPHSIHNGEAICQKCNARTCAKCRAQWHFGPCSDAGDTGLMGLAEAKEWKRCPQCRRMIEKVDGCNHLLCRCGFNFCYGCGQDVDKCKCEFDPDADDEDDVRDEEDESEHLHEIIEEHLQEHHSEYQTLAEKDGHFECDLCERIYSDWISECVECGLRVCKRCQKNHRGD